MDNSFKIQKNHTIYDRIDFIQDASPVDGIVKWSPTKSFWWSFMTLCWLIFGSLYFSISAVLVFLILCASTLCLGHSIGMHRKLIHNSFESKKWVERIFIYLGTLVGLGGPFTMMHTHDMRDWAQRQPKCHNFLSHQQSFITDFWQQLHCKLHLEKPPEFIFPGKLTDDLFYRFIQATSMLQQIPLGIILFYFGGLGWVAWGICGRVSISIFGHWLIGYFAHNSGQRDWHLEDVSVQGFNIPHLGLITFGECWHNNHHAFPNSAKLGHGKDQFDPGWYVLLALQKLGLVWDLNTPDKLPIPNNLIHIKN